MLATIAAARISALENVGAGTADTLTGGFSWLFLGAAALAVLEGASIALIGERR